MPQVSHLEPLPAKESPLELSQHYKGICAGFVETRFARLKQLSNPSREKKDTVSQPLIEWNNKNPDYLCHQFYSNWVDWKENASQCQMWSRFYDPGAGPGFFLGGRRVHL